MNRRLCKLIGLLFIVARVTAQTGNVSGVWAGALGGDPAPGGMQLILMRDGTSWKATLTLRLEGEEMTPPVADLNINADQISFSTMIGKTTIKFFGSFNGEKLDGTLEAFQNDRRVGKGTMSLARGGQMPPLQRPQPHEQIADVNFDVRVAEPAHPKLRRVLFDEAHNNFHTAGGRYKPFADLISNDGYEVTSNKQRFTSETLRGYDILVIANALGSADAGSSDATKPAFTDGECDAVRDWVRNGGALLLISDHAPAGAANQILAQRFGIDMRNAVTVDERNYAKDTDNPGNIVYTRDSGRLADHAITRGRNVAERVNTIIAFTGQSLTGPAHSFAFMRLADTAQDRMSGSEKPVSAAGRAQGIALTLGKGRVVCLGEAAMLSAQIAEPEHTKFGMNYPGTDNRQLALNIMHWLSRLLT